MAIFNSYVKLPEGTQHNFSASFETDKKDHPNGQTDLLQLIWLWIRFSQKLAGQSKTCLKPCWNHQSCPFFWCVSQFRKPVLNTQKKTQVHKYVHTKSVKVPRFLFSQQIHQQIHQIVGHWPTLQVLLLSLGLFSLPPGLVHFGYCIIKPPKRVQFITYFSGNFFYTCLYWWGFTNIQYIDYIYI